MSTLLLRVAALLCTTILASGAVAQKSAAVVEPTAPAPTRFAELTDAELTQLSARWSELDAEQRRALLKTVQARMLRSRPGRQRIPLRPTHRYGEGYRTGTSVITVKREVRSRDGTVHSSTQVLTFGTGFEQRAGVEPTRTAPATSVGMPSAGKKPGAAPRPPLSPAAGRPEQGLPGEQHAR